MKKQEMDKSLQEIALTRNALYKLGYDNPKYDLIEDKMHQLEDDFQAKYGEKLKKALKQVHDRYCTDTEVLHPISYLAKSYHINDKNEYDVDSSMGISVKIKGKDTKQDAKLVVVPNPTRIVLNISPQEQKVVWTEQPPSDT